MLALNRSAINYTLGLGGGVGLVSSYKLEQMNGKFETFPKQFFEFLLFMGGLMGGHSALSFLGNETHLMRVEVGKPNYLLKLTCLSATVLFLFMIGIQVRSPTDADTLTHHARPHVSTHTRT